MATVESWKNHTCFIYDDPTLVSHVQGLLVRKSKTKPSEAVEVAKAFLNSVSGKVIYKLSAHIANKAIRDMMASASTKGAA